MYEVRDEFGNLLNGTHPESPYYGIPYVEGDLACVIQCDSGIFPPNADGTCYFATPLLFTTRIGIGTAPLFQQPARFADSVVPRPTGSIFIRIFNAPNLEDASFYADSHIHSMADGDSVFRTEVLQTLQPLDPNDDDGDGLNNSWEKSYGSDTDDEDSDDDGIIDGLEHLAGTSPTDADCYLGMTRIAPVAGGIRIQWASVPDQPYDIETFSIRTPDTTFEPVVSGLVATGTITYVVITNNTDASACYRVCKSSS